MSEFGDVKSVDSGLTRPRLKHTSARLTSSQGQGTDCSAIAAIVNFEPTLTSDQAAQLLKIHPKTLQRMARKGQVPAHRIGDLWRFRASELDSWLRSQSGRIRSPLVP